MRTKLRCLDAAVVAKEQWGHMLEDNAEKEAEKLESEYAEATEKFSEEELERIRKEEGLEDTDADIESITGEGLSNEE